MTKRTRRARPILSVKTAAAINLLSGSLFAGCVSYNERPVNCDLGDNEAYCERDRDLAVPDLSERDQKPPSED
jgi:hypothetical protein